MSIEYFEEEQLNKSRRKRELERRKKERLAKDEFSPRNKSSRRNRHEIRHALKQWDVLEEELQYELLTDR